MNLKRTLCASSIAAGVGVAGLFGTGIATANAAPAPCSALAGQACAPAPTVKLNHHERKKALKQDKKELKRPQQITPASKSHVR